MIQPLSHTKAWIPGGRSYGGLPRVGHPQGVTTPAENLNVVAKHHKLAILDVVSDKTLLKKILFYVLNSCWDYR